MPNDEDLPVRLRKPLARRPEVAEKRRFGGVGFFLDGNMLVGVWRDALVARPFAPAGRPLRGWVLVDTPGVDDDADLARWVDRAAAFVETLPPKSP